jgi:hypothetical protein
MENFDDAKMLKSFGEVPKTLDELRRLDASPAGGVSHSDRGDYPKWMGRSVGHRFFISDQRVATLID